jgi:hypothetical protein
MSTHFIPKEKNVRRCKQFPIKGKKLPALSSLHGQVALSNRVVSWNTAAPIRPDCLWRVIPIAATYLPIRLVRGMQRFFRSADRRAADPKWHQF